MGPGCRSNGMLRKYSIVLWNLLTLVSLDSRKITSSKYKPPSSAISLSLLRIQVQYKHLSPKNRCELTSLFYIGLQQTICSNMKRKEMKRYFEKKVKQMGQYSLHLSERPQRKMSTCCLKSLLKINATCWHVPLLFLESVSQRCFLTWPLYFQYWQKTLLFSLEESFLPKKQKQKKSANMSKVLHKQSTAA